jgi:hypothetical protein
MLDSHPLLKWNNNPVMSVSNLAFDLPLADRQRITSKKNPPIEAEAGSGHA